MTSWLDLPFEVKQVVITYWLAGATQTKRRVGDPAEGVWGASIRYGAQRAMWRSLGGLTEVAPEMTSEVLRLIFGAWQRCSRELAQWLKEEYERLGMQEDEEQLWRRELEYGRHVWVTFTDERDILYNTLRLLAMKASHRRRIYGPGFDGLFYAAEMRELGLYWDNKKAELIEVADGEAYTTGDGKRRKLGKAPPPPPPQKTPAVRRKISFSKLFNRSFSAIKGRGRSKTEVGAVNEET